MRLIDHVILGFEILALQLVCWFTRKLSINYVFLASIVRLKKNLKVWLIKTIKNLDGRVIEEILSSINKSLGESQSVVVRAWDN